MPLYLFFRSAEADRNAAQVHSALVDAADEPTAREKLAERAPFAIKTGGWSCEQVAPAGTLASPRNPIFFDGDACTMLGRFRGQ